MSRGSTYLEVQAAFATLGLVLAGFAPIVVAGQRMLVRIEARARPAVGLYLNPPADEWSRKLGVAATLVPADPGPFAPASVGDPENDVAIVVGSFSRSIADDVASVSVVVTPRPKDGGGP